MKRFYLVIFIGLAFGVGSCGDEKVKVDFPSSNLAIVSWDGLKGKEFLIERSGEEGLSLLAIIRDGRKFPDGSIEKGRYCWKVKSDEEECEVCKDVPEDKKSNVPPPSSPSNLTGAYIDGKIYLEWKDKSDNEDGFKVLRCDKEEEGGPHCVTIAVLEKDTTSFIYEGADGSYCYRVQAYNEGGDFGYSNKVCIDIEYRMQCGDMRWSG